VLEIGKTRCLDGERTCGAPAAIDACRAFPATDPVRAAELSANQLCTVPTMRYRSMRKKTPIILVGTKLDLQDDGKLNQVIEAKRHGLPHPTSGHPPGQANHGKQTSSNVRDVIANSGETNVGRRYHR
jgi:GTPase SAR1 family protein